MDHTSRKIVRNKDQSNSVSFKWESGQCFWDDSKGSGHVYSSSDEYGIGKRLSGSITVRMCCQGCVVWEKEQVIRAFRSTEIQSRFGEMTQAGWRKKKKKGERKKKKREGLCNGL